MDDERLIVKSEYNTNNILNDNRDIHNAVYRQIQNTHEEVDFDHTTWVSSVYIDFPIGLQFDV